MSNPRPDGRSDGERTGDSQESVEQAAAAAVDALDADVDESALRRDLAATLADHVDGAAVTLGTQRVRPAAADLLGAEQLLDALALPAFVLAPDHTLVAYNEGLADLLGIDTEEAVGEDYREVVSYAVYADGRRELSLADKVVEAPRDAADEFDTVSRVDDRTEYTGEFVYEDTSTMRNRLGEEIPIGFIATPFFEDGELVAVLEVVEERESELEEFPGLAGIISHDLRNPLEVARSYTELAADDLDEEYYERITESLDRMADIVEEVMALYRQADADQDRQVQDLSRLAEQAWETVDTGDATLDVEQVTAAGDRAQLLRLFENLFRNAIEHGGDGVTVRVGLLADRDGFYVADDGVGIPPEERDAILEHGHSTADAGTGFGLSIVHQVVRNHGWRLEVTESAEGGARFEVVFAA